MAGPGAPDWTQSVVDVLQGAPLWTKGADVGNAATGTWTLAPPPTPEALGFVLGAVLTFSGTALGPGTLTVSVRQEQIVICEAVVQSGFGGISAPWQYFPTIIWNGSTNPGYNLFISYTFVFPPGLTVTDVNMYLAGYAQALPIPPSQSPSAVSGTVTANQGTAGSGAWPVSLPAGQAVELLDASGVNKAAVSAAGAVSVAPPNPLPVSGTVTANVAGLANPLPTSDVADVAPGAALPAKVLVIAGSDLTDARPIQTDSAGRIILGSPSTTLPVTQSTSPWLVQDAADVAPGAAVPAKALWVAGTDGTDARGLLTDTQGRLIVTPQAPSTAAGQHPVVERTWWSVNISSSGNLLGAPGAGVRYRIYWAKLTLVSGSGTAYIAGQIYGTLCYVSSSPLVAVDYADLKEAGVPWGLNTPVAVNISGTTNVEACVLYTTETV
jgi:hypothetical protein